MKNTLAMSVPLSSALLLLRASVSSLPAEVIRDIEFARVEDRSLMLDLYVPDADGKSPLIVWVHGGAWRGGSRSTVPIRPLVSRGWAIASVDYRLSTEAPFPAQVHDIKAAIRYLRSHAEQRGLDAERFFIAGASAGGHLANLVGVSRGHAELEGRVGAHLDTSSAVKGIVSYYGAANLVTILGQSTPHGLSVRRPALDLLLGGPPEDAPELYHLASPVFHVDAEDPPLLLFHGDQDPQMPINQSHELHGVYEANGLRTKFVVLHGATHGGKVFYDDDHLNIVDGWLKGID